MAIEGLLKETFLILLDSPDYTLILLTFGVGAVMILSLIEAWKYVRGVANERF